MASSLESNPHRHSFSPGQFSTGRRALSGIFRLELKNARRRLRKTVVQPKDKKTKNEAVVLRGVARRVVFWPLPASDTKTILVL